MYIPSYIRKWRNQHLLRRRAHAVLISLNTQARNPFFYTACGVPDTVDGRFEILTLHMFLILHQLKKIPEQEEFCRLLTEAHFATLDRAIRQEGIGDTGVSRRIKTMANAFFGRLEAYERSQDFHTLLHSLQRNVYAAGVVENNKIEPLAEYVKRNSDHLSKVSADMIMHYQFL